MLINVLPGPAYPEFTYMSKEDAERMAEYKPVCALCDAGRPAIPAKARIPLHSINGAPTNGGYWEVSLEFAQKLKAVLDTYDK